MKLTFGATSFEAKPTNLHWHYNEAKDQAESGRPKVINSWNCAEGGFYHPNPPTLKIDAYARLIIHAAQPGGRIPFDADPTGWDKARRKANVDRNSLRLGQWLLKEAGFKDSDALGSWLQKNLGGKPGQKIPLDALTKPYKPDKSVQVVSTVDYEVFELDHHKMPQFFESSILLLIPTALIHTVTISAICTKQGQLTIPGWEIATPAAVKTERLPSTTKAERALRKDKNKKLQKELRKDIKDFDARRKKSKEKLKKLQEEANKLKEETR